ncbi:phosphopantetheine-binding protein [Pseudomonas agarici]|uniref:phosphopantetheine-binding protein n=3 Tax=Pseudomonas agarici TaxID=46677 RepID=UPI003F7508A8
MTAEKFVPNPFGESGERLYRTGDLCRYRRDGVLEYVGRIDHQVKVRGFRIELGEIEARLLVQGQLQEVAVLAVEGGAGSQLVAYAVPLAGRVDGESAQVLRETLKGVLRSSLPDYMVPAHWLFLEALPLTPNGKLDRKALPGVDETLVRRAWRAPQGELEGEVALIWQDVLQVERVGLDDNFFDLGGHSLLATQVIVRLRNQLRAEVPLKSLFETHDLQAFCRCVETHRTVHQSLDEELAKSLEALKRLSSNELEKLIS